MGNSRFPALFILAIGALAGYMVANYNARATSQRAAEQAARQLSRYPNEAIGIEGSSCSGASLTGVNDSDYKPPFKFAGKLQKVTLTNDRPKLTPEDIKKLEEAKRSAERSRE